MKIRLDQNHIPPVAMHPGELLRNEIKERGLKQTDLANKLSISQPFLNGLLREKKKISIELAIKLEEVLGIEAELWVKLQRLFDKMETRNKTEISLQNLNISSQKRESILGAMMAWKLTIVSGNIKNNKILALIIGGISVLLMFFPVHLYYEYHFSGKLFYFMYSDWVLLMNFLIAITGIFLSRLLYRGKVGVKITLFTTVILWILTFYNYFNI